MPAIHPPGLGQALGILDLVQAKKTSIPFLLSLPEDDVDNHNLNGVKVRPWLA